MLTKQFMPRKYTPRIRTQLRQAQRVERNNKLSAAEKLYRAIVEQSADVAEAWVGLGNVAHDSAESQAAYERALELDPENNTARVALGMEPIPDPEPEPEPDAPPVAPDSGPEEGDAASARQPAANGNGAADAAPGGHSPAPQAVQESRARTQPVTVPDTVAPKPNPEPAQPHAHTLAPAGAAVEGATEETLACKNHPDRQTTLRCYRCNEPICKDCAKRTSVGYLCPQCVYAAEEKFFTATVRDYIVGAVISLVLSSIAAWFASILGFWVIFVAAAVGTLIGTATFYAVGRRRGRYLPYIVVAMVIAGVAPAILGNLLFSFGSLSVIWLVVYVVLASSSAYYRMRY